MTTVTYLKTYPYSGNKPYADVLLIGSGPASQRTFKCLVDTGADYLQLPATAAVSAGISLQNGSQQNVRTAAASVTMTLVTGVPIEIEGVPVIVDVLFHPSANSPALLGRTALLAAFDAGFTPTDWLSA